MLEHIPDIEFNFFLWLRYFGVSNRSFFLQNYTLLSIAQTLKLIAPSWRMIPIMLCKLSTRPSNERPRNSLKFFLYEYGKMNHTISDPIDFLSCVFLRSIQRIISIYFVKFPLNIIYWTTFLIDRRRFLSCIWNKFIPFII